MVRTLAWARHRDGQNGIKVYFCEPRSPWQRPTNEHTNGLLRRWLPKSTDLNIQQTPPLEHRPNRLR